METGWIILLILFLLGVTPWIFVKLGKKAAQNVEEELQEDIVKEKQQEECEEKEQKSQERQKIVIPISKPLIYLFFVGGWIYWGVTIFKKGFARVLYSNPWWVIWWVFFGIMGMIYLFKKLSKYIEFR